MSQPGGSICSSIIKTTGTTTQVAKSITKSSVWPLICGAWVLTSNFLAIGPSNQSSRWQTINQIKPSLIRPSKMAASANKPAIAPNAVKACTLNPATTSLRSVKSIMSNSSAKSLRRFFRSGRRIEARKCFICLDI